MFNIDDFFQHFPVFLPQKILANFVNPFNILNFVNFDQQIYEILLYKS